MGQCKSFWRVRVLACCMVGAFCHHAAALDLDRGHQIILRRGLQMHALVLDYTSFSHTTWAASNFTTVNFWATAKPDFLGSPPGIPWGRWTDGGNNGVGGPLELLTSAEMPFASSLVSLQIGDEQGLGNPDIVAGIADLMDQHNSLYPHAMTYVNHGGHQLTNATLQNFMAIAEPDMLCMDTYPFDGIVWGGSPTGLYEDLERYRKLGLAGNDGTGTRPIPTGVYIQTFWDGSYWDRPVSESEGTLNQFAAWAFGFKLTHAFIYDVTTVGTFIPMLFNSGGDGSPSLFFNRVANNNAESRRLGPALTRLVSTDVRMQMGRHVMYSAVVNNTMPEDVAEWTPTADTYMTALSAENLNPAVNDGLEGDVIIGYFKVLHEDFDGPNANGERYFMVVNGLSDQYQPPETSQQNIQIDFDFLNSGITSLQRLNRGTGQVEVVPLTHLGGSRYRLDLVLGGGQGDLFKYNTGAPFVGVDLGSWVVQAEDYNTGGQNLTYYDTTPGNSGGSGYRNDDVDIAEYGTADENTPIRYTVNNVATSEWLEFTIDVPQAGNYKIAVCWNKATTGRPRVQADIGPLGGAFEYSSGSVRMPGVSGWRTDEIASGASLTAGTKTMRFTVTNDGSGSIAEIDSFLLMLLNGVQKPFPSQTVPHAVPGTIEAAHFDVGGPGISYSDTTAWQQNMAPNAVAFRASEVDALISKTEGGFVGSIAPNEWLEYTVDVAETGLYEVLVRYAADAAGKTFDITDESGGGSIFGTQQTLPWALGGLNDFGSAYFLANLTAGQRVLRFQTATGGFNLKQIEFKKVAGDLPTDDAGFWRFDIDGKNPGEYAGTVKDLSTNGNDGVASGGATYSGNIPPLDSNGPGVGTPNHTRHGGYLNRMSAEFTRASGQHIAVPHSDSLSFGDTSFRVGAWVRPFSVPTGTSTPAERQWLLCKKAGGTPDSAIDYAVLAGGADLTLNPTFSNYHQDYGNPYVSDGTELVLLFGTGSSIETVASRLRIDNTNWRFVEVSYNAEKQEVIFIIDGEEWDRVIGVTRSGSSPNTGPLYIGGHVNASGVVDQFIDASLDEIRITPRPFTGTPSHTGPYQTSWFWENDGSAPPDGMISQDFLRPFAARRSGIVDHSRCFWDIVPVVGEEGNHALHVYDADEIGSLYSPYLFWDNTCAGGNPPGEVSTPWLLGRGLTFEMRFMLTRFRSNRDTFPPDGGDGDGAGCKFIRFVSDLNDVTVSTNAKLNWEIGYADGNARTGIALWSGSMIDTDGDDLADGKWHSGDLSDEWHTLYAVAFVDDSGHIRQRTWLDPETNPDPVEDFLRVDELGNPLYETVIDPIFGLNDHMAPQQWTTEAYIDYVRMHGAGAWDPDGNLLPLFDSPLPDLDRDGDVDQVDFGAFQKCLTGIGRPQDDPLCQDAKLDSDSDVDEIDLAIFEGCYSGPEVLADPDCVE